jgi:hypothetical protein
MRPELSPEAGSRTARWRAFQAVPGERRGDLPGAQPRPGPRRSRRAAVHRLQVRPRRPGQPRRAERHRSIPIGRHTGPLRLPVRARCARVWTGWMPGASSGPAAPGIVAARIKRADRRPQGWDLNLGMAGDDLAEAGIVKPERQSPALLPGSRSWHDPDLTIRPTGAATALHARNRRACG